MNEPKIKIIIQKRISPKYFIITKKKLSQERKMEARTAAFKNIKNKTLGVLQPLQAFSFT